MSCTVMSMTRAAPLKPCQCHNHVRPNNQRALQCTINQDMHVWYPSTKPSHGRDPLKTYRQHHEASNQVYHEPGSVSNGRNFASQTSPVCCSFFALCAYHLDLLLDRSS